MFILEKFKGKKYHLFLHDPGDILDVFQPHVLSNILLQFQSYLGYNIDNIIYIFHNIVKTLHHVLYVSLLKIYFKNFMFQDIRSD